MQVKELYWLSHSNIILLLINLNHNYVSDLNQFLSFKSTPSYFQQSSVPFTHSISEKNSNSTHRFHSINFLRMHSLLLEILQLNYKKTCIPNVNLEAKNLLITLFPPPISQNHLWRQTNRISSPPSFSVLMLVSKKIPQVSTAETKECLCISHSDFHTFRTSNFFQA